MDSGREAPPLVRCRVCANPLWWDMTPVPALAPGWYCSTCRHPPERYRNPAAVAPQCPQGCASSITEVGPDGLRKFICHRG
ncbi:hypothetical protein ACIHFE_29570 [Streptomyces sp. NPDC052396]|uniref:hypothetical protein n=1 Tax=Streptomyces sp. NPDC052396 TaxID=3365689 RepID=UPI0037D7D2B0